MKINWGTSIAIFYGSFMVLMIGMVIVSRTHDVNLVTPDYYQKELDYQSEIDAMQNTQNLKEKIKIDYDGQQITIDLAKFDQSVKGDVVLFRPSDHKLDKTLALAISEDSKMVIPTQGLKSGVWIVKLAWKSEGKSYQYKDSVFL